MAKLTSALHQLRAEQREAQLYVEKLGHGVGKGAKPAEGAAKTTASAPVKRTMSASARRKIAGLGGRSSGWRRRKRRKTRRENKARCFRGAPYPFNSF